MLSYDLRTTPPALNYKIMTGLITPRPIALVTSIDRDGRVNAAPFSYFNAFGSDPARLSSKAPAIDRACK